MSNPSEVPGYVPPAGWRIKRDDENAADGDGFTHTRYGHEWTEPRRFTLDDLRRDGYTPEERPVTVAQLKARYMPSGGYILTPFTPTDVEREILPEELPQPSPHMIIVDDPLQPPTQHDCTLDDMRRMDEEIRRNAENDDLPTRTPLTSTDQLFPQYPAATFYAAMEDAKRCTDPVLPAAGWPYTVKPPEAESLLPGDVLMAGGKAASSACPPYHLIPKAALAMLANQCGLGVKRKGSKAWNALSNNQDVLLNREFVLERIAHVINHALKARDRILSGNFEDMEGENDMAAVMWGGMFLCAAADAMMKEQGMQTPDLKR